jgi:hypothetical protein
LSRAVIKSPLPHNEPATIRGSLSILSGDPPSDLVGTLGRIPTTQPVFFSRKPNRTITMVLRIHRSRSLSQRHTTRGPPKPRRCRSPRTFRRGSGAASAPARGQLQVRWRGWIVPSRWPRRNSSHPHHTRNSHALGHRDVLPLAGWAHDHQRTQATVQRLRRKPLRTSH